MRCNQICKWNSNVGCVKPYGVPCILENVSPTDKKATNADRIRDMSDEELEEGIRSLSLGYEPWCDYHCKMKGEDDCNRCLRIWLQQPAEPPREEG